MTKIIKICCNGPNKCVNEVDLEKVVKKDVVLRGTRPEMDRSSSRSITERVVLPCRICTEGKVVITGAIIEDNL